MRRHTKILKMTVLALVLILLISSLTGCGEAVTKAKETIESFCTALENQDSTAALSLMHPSIEMTEEELVSSISEIEEELNISFADGVTIVIFKDPSVNYTFNIPDGLVGVVSIKLDIIVSGNFLTASVMLLEAGGTVGIQSFVLSAHQDEEENEKVNTDDTINSL